ncbi:MAG TPA: hypothetical protein VEK80_00235 [Kribbellaceae bacterium]|nr:hypothetical protein [Kribbellaceae bacterium]
MTENEKFEELQGRVVKIEMLLKATTGVDLGELTVDDLDAMISRVGEALASFPGPMPLASVPRCSIFSSPKCSAPGAYSPEPRRASRSADGREVGAVRRFAALGG